MVGLTASELLLHGEDLDEGDGASFGSSHSKTSTTWLGIGCQLIRGSMLVDRPFSSGFFVVHKWIDKG